jgi:hypothetical protein
VTDRCIVVVAAPELLSSLKERVGDGAAEVLGFPDADALGALEVITARRPPLVVLERVFATTPRGAALINRIKADPSLDQCEVHVVSGDADFRRPVPRRAADSSGGGATAVAAVRAPTLDQRGTRRAPRFRVASGVEVLVDGNSAALVDLSTLGAQVVSATVLKPNQRIRMLLTDEQGSVRFNALVAWAAFEIPPTSGPRYRAGLEFLDANPTAVDAYCLRHRT